MTTQRGFTLIEMAIVLVIITFLVGGLIMPLSAQIQARRNSETKQILEEAREAIIGYAMTHAVDDDSDSNTTPITYLPCPDSDDDGVVDGHENRNSDGTCVENAGFFPWVDLGVASKDAWGNRLRYAVSDFGEMQVVPGPKKGFSACGSLTTTMPTPLVICSSYNCTSASPDIADKVAFVLVSHGPNSRGARNVNLENNSPTPAPPPGTSNNELRNLDADERYVSRLPTKSDDETNGEFDDLVVWVSGTQLVGRIFSGTTSGCP